MRIEATITDLEGNEYGELVIDEPKYQALQTLQRMQDLILETSHGTLEYKYDRDSIKQCKMCDKLYHVSDEELGGRTGKSGFCSLDCKEEADEEMRVFDARREFE